MILRMVMDASGSGNMSNREGKNRYKKFMGTRRKQLCPKCQKGHLQPCGCGCKNVGNHVLECNVCNFVNY